jgi:hypothetical protein
MVDGREVPGSDRPDAEVRRTTDGFAEAMGLRLRAGRSFTAQEAAAGAPVVVVSRATAERFWPGRSALGRTVSTGGDWSTVIGVVDDISGQHRGDAPRPQLYYPAGDHGSRSMSLVARTPGDAAALAPRCAAPSARSTPAWPWPTCTRWPRSPGSRSGGSGSSGGCSPRSASSRSCWRSPASTR